MSTMTEFDLAGFRRATEDRDAHRVLDMYADDARVRIVDRDHPPRSPRTLTGKPEISSWLEDVFSRDMTHHVVDPMIDADHVALTEECAYPDGTQVLCSCTAEVHDGKISKQTIIQVWDEMPLA